MLRDKYLDLVCVAVLCISTLAHGGQLKPPAIKPSADQDTAPTEQAASPEFEGRVIAISSIPQLEPDPPLRYSLIPDYSDIKVGNAAPCYFRAILMMPREKEMRYGEKQSSWLEAPLKQFPKEKAHEFLKPYANSLKEIKIATYRDHCEWDLQVRQRKGMDVMALLLPEIQELRALARVLRLKSRLEIAEARFDDARESLVMGYQLSANVSGSSVLINDLVAVAIAGLMNDSVVDWIDANGPNLYWGLASLPRPLVDIRKALQQEMNLPLQMFPFLNDPESQAYTPQQWRQVIGDSLVQLHGVSGAKPTMAAQTMATGLILAGYSSAKQALIDDGMDAARVEEMPVGQVVAVQSARVYRKVQHEYTKWMYLPFWQSYRKMAQSIKRLNADGYLRWGGKPGTVPIAAMFLPAIESTFLAPVRMQRDIAALQTIEAIRMATATADGKLPDRIDDLQQCPAPRDPVTGEPFVYRIEGKKAVLLLAPPEGRPATQFAKRYDVSLKD